MRAIRASFCIASISSSPVRNYAFIGAATWQLAEIAHERGDAPGALEALEKSMEVALRETVRTGEHEDSAYGVACEALRVALLGADRLSFFLCA
jgi:hypothetical protein